MAVVAMLLSVLWMLAQTGDGGSQLPIIIPSAGLLTVALAIAGWGFRVFTRSVGSVTSRLAVVENENALLRHQQGWGDRRLAWLARHALAAGVHIPTAFWADAGPTDRPYPDLNRESL